jgi:hypothetical protein
MCLCGKSPFLKPESPSLTIFFVVQFDKIQENRPILDGRDQTCHWLDESWTWLAPLSLSPDVVGEQGGHSKYVNCQDVEIDQSIAV